MNVANGKGRGWAGRAGFVVAALACVATSRPRWHLDVTPPAVPTAPGQGLLLTLESSHTPDVSLLLGDQSLVAPPVKPVSSWDTSATYFIPPAASITHLSIGGHDGQGGGLCSSPQPPPGAFLRVARTEPIAAWHHEATGPKQTLSLPAGTNGFSASSEIEFEAADGVRRVQIAWLEPQPAGLTNPYLSPNGGSGGHYSYKVYWPSVPAGVTVVWAPRVLLDGPCPDTQPCAPPPGALRALTVKAAAP